MKIQAGSRVVARGFVATLLALVMAASGVVTNPASAIAGSTARQPRSSSLVALASLFSTLMPTGLLRAIEGGQAVSAGSDGRLTILLLGSDTRGAGVARTDTMMVMSLDLATHKINAASIPRDTARIPNPAGGTFSGRVNAILKKLRKTSTSVNQALAKLVVVVEELLGGKSNPLEIDYYAMVSFPAFNALVDEVEPISINTGSAIRDSKFWDDPNLPKGVYFPGAQTGYQLWALQPSNSISGNGTCNGLWVTKGTTPDYWCRKALPYVRSRKGAGNSDFVRARRQQNFVGATIDRVIQRGSTGNLTALVSSALAQNNAGTLYTDVPITVANGLDLFSKLTGAQLDKQVVFSPTTYATRIPGTSAYELKLPAVRAWVDANLR